MGRFLMAIGIAGLVALAAGEAPAVAGKAGAADRLHAGKPRSLQMPATGLTSCDLCAGLTCATVQVRGRCTLNKAVAALRRQQGHRLPARKVAPGTIRHRERAVTKGDYAELAGSAPARVGRAEVKPRRSPQSDGDAASRLLDIYEKGGRSLRVRESKASALGTRQLRPLKLNDGEPDKDADKDSK